MMMKPLFYLITFIPKPLFSFLIDIYFASRAYKYSSNFKITKKNIEIAYPNRSKSDIQILSKLSLKESFLSGYESIYSWGSSEFESNDNLLCVENNFLLNNLKQNGLIAVSFHNRSVDMLLTWMNSQHTTVSLYKKIKNNALNYFVKSKRESGNSKCYETNIGGVRHLYKALQDKKIVCFAADQVPKRGLGEHIEFFNVKAYSTTLVQSLASKSKVPVIYFYIQSNQNRNLKVKIKSCHDSIYNDSKCKLLVNKDIENFINERPSDYSWEYKRFKRSKNLPNDPYENM
tara:strand:+ start:1618 stop:2481 length:864 start_codon:yes stop_codon:yes gene_type:complete